MSPARLDRAIYCNRSVKMDRIKLVGFDLDHTLIHYNHAEVDRLCVQVTLEGLVADRSYPEEIVDLTYDLSFAIRGLVVDLEHGHVLKLNRNGRVKRASHGFRFLTKNERARLYRGARFRKSEERYRWIDTLYDPVEVVIYSALVDFFDRRSGGPSYRQLYIDFLEVLTEKHTQGAIQGPVSSHPDRYVHGDPDLAETLRWLRLAGKTPFLLTNSPWGYTDKIMAHLLPEQQHGMPWRQHFDFVFVSSRKPAFFRSDVPFHELDAASGAVVNENVEQFVPGAVYLGGNVNAFERLTGLPGEQVLYVGDHIYSDIMQARKEHTWRTLLVMHDLPRELAASARAAALLPALDELEEEHQQLELELEDMELRMRTQDRVKDNDLAQAGQGDRTAPGRQREALRERQQAVRDQIRRLAREIESEFHPLWGALFREGREESGFARQIMDFADLYTARATNLLHCSLARTFRPPLLAMPHELAGRSR